MFIFSSTLFCESLGCGLFSQEKPGVLCTRDFPYRVCVGIRWTSTPGEILASPFLDARSQLPFSPRSWDLQLLGVECDGV